MNRDFSKMAGYLMELPQKISDLQFEIVDKTDFSKDLSNKIAKIESEIKVLISNKVDSSGKKVYSNAEARDAAFIEDTNSSENLKSLKLDFDCLQREMSERRVLVEQLNNEQRNIRSLLHFFANNQEL